MRAIQVISLFVIICCVIASGSLQASLEETVDYAPSENALSRARFSLPKVFDFDGYRQAFKKTYHTAIEMIVRQKLFLARAYRAAISAIKYKYNLSPYYLKINERSDWTSAESKASRNKILFGGKDEESEQINELPAEQQIDLATIREELDQVKQNAKDVGFKEIANELDSLTNQNQNSRRRRRREVSLPTRDISLANIIGKPDDDEETPEVKAKLVKIVPSNNPLRVEPETDSFGTSDLIGTIKIVDDKYFYKAANSPQPPAPAYEGITFGSLAAQIFNAANGLLTGNSGEDESASDDTMEVEKPMEDAVFVDHRRSNCFFKPRSQGVCGCCYAFAFISYLEYMNCMETGQMVPFSEQYLIDCGWRTEMDGCDGANLPNTGRFLLEYGLELRVSYPFRERRDECPWSNETIPAHMGYMRPGVKSLIEVPNTSDALESMLAKSPIVIGISTVGDFEEYGGGIHTGSGCTDKADHAVVLIGHGRENGVEYWIIRNSHSTSFGEGGYYRVRKDANCVQNSGFILGNSADFPGFKPKPNENYDPKIVKRHYMENMKKEVLKTSKI